MKNKVLCRFCKKHLTHTVVDLGMTPIANDYVRGENAERMEPFYPLHVYVCNHCWLVQLPNIRREDEIFTDDYAYFSSFSKSWLEHSKAYVDMMIERFGFSQDTLVVELASNDGYLLQYFKEQNVPVLGIEPTANTAKVAQKKGIKTLVEFFGVDIARKLSKKGTKADLIIANNVLAHVPDLNDFVGGMKVLLNREGIVTVEFPHALNMIERNQFDQIYHEHYSYFSFITVNKIFAYHGMTIFDVQELKTHGGSLRIFAKHTASNRPVSKAVTDLLAKEKAHGLTKVKTYQEFGEKVKITKQRILQKLIDLKSHGKTIIGYGAPAKGNTLLNYCGIRTDLLDYTVDISPYKQNRYLPGTRIPIKNPRQIYKTKPDYIFILPWNLKDEIMTQMKDVRRWGGKFVVPVPKVKIY